MGYFSCSAESAIAVCSCDPYYSDLRRKTRRRRKPHKQVPIREFSYSELFSATNGFSPEFFLGKGSHGSVFKAAIDGGGLIAAVKKTKISNPSRNFSGSPAENEIEILSELHHRRIVNLIGFCSGSNDEKLLVVEFMPNGSLYDLLHSRSRPPGWTRRLRFAVQVAKAVRALHSSDPPVIHRDIKSSNVLIDKNFNARIGDFGLALRGRVDDERVRCTPPAGTLGYLDPGYVSPGDLSAKSDVFSFGILLLEIISGRNAIDVNHSPPSVVDWAVPMIKQGDYEGICDRRIGSPADRALVRRMAVLAAKCVRSTVHKRPEMAEVVECLKMAKRKVHAPTIFSKCRRPERHVENLQPLINRGGSDAGDELAPAGVCRIGSRRNRKISSVSCSEYGNKSLFTGSSSRVVRSKSMGHVSNFGGNCSSLGGRRKNGGVAVKIPAVKLRKSRSVGALENPPEYYRKSLEIGMLKLAIDFDAKSEKKMLEKPLVLNKQS